jgi:hypothetical protein
MSFVGDMRKSAWVPCSLTVIDFDCDDLALAARCSQSFDLPSMLG